MKLRTDSVRPWRAEEDDILREMVAAAAPIDDMVEALDRSPVAIHCRKHKLCLYVSKTSNAVATILLDRDRRQEARHRLDLTGQIFGDPPPGFSALDRRMGKVTA